MLLKLLSSKVALLICKPIYSSRSTPMANNAVEPITRRSANYEPSLWSFDHIQSLSSKYKEEDYMKRADYLKKAVKMMIHKNYKRENPLSTLELIDDLRRLGISYHFEKEISDVFDMIYFDQYKNHDNWNRMDLNLKALGFRLLRQHGYHITQDIFNNFKDEAQNLKPYSNEDIVGILNLYEASYYALEDETILDDAKDFTTKCLKENLQNIDGNVLSLVSHALEFPLHWRAPRVEAKWFIDFYDKRSDMNPTIYELAKLDFNMLQAIHLEDLKECSRWWRQMSWDKKLCFGRDRLVECFLWTIGIGYQPNFSLGRKTITKVCAMITTIDDIYDVYGTLDELKKFTDVMSRWDINAIEELPDYMKICFLGVYNSINEITYNTLTNTGILIHSYLKNAWADLCKADLLEAEWYHTGHIPTFEQYMDNACISIGVPIALMHFNFLTSVTSTEEILQFMEKTNDITRYISTIVRLVDDLATSSDEMARGDIPKAMQCYIHETDASEDEAKRHITMLINKTWKKLNKERAFANSRFSHEFIDFATNLARIAQFMYGEGDGHGCPHVNKSNILSLLFNPV